MGFITLKIYPDGRIERAERAQSWREREELIAYALYLQPGLAALDVAARLWRDLRGQPVGLSGVELGPVGRARRPDEGGRP